MLHVTGLVVVFLVVPISKERWWLGIVIGLLIIVGSVPLTVKRINRVATSHEPYLEAGLAVVMMIALIVIGFASIYAALSRHGEEFTDIHTKLDAVYFTVTTVATVGYGDLAPSGQIARAVAIIQMVVDILVIGVAARLAMRVAARETEARKSCRFTSAPKVGRRGCSSSPLHWNRVRSQSGSRSTMHRPKQLCRTISCARCSSDRRNVCRTS